MRNRKTTYRHRCRRAAPRYFRAHSSLDRTRVRWYKRLIFWAGRKALVHPRAGTFSPPFLYPEENDGRAERLHRRVGRFRALRAPRPYYIITLLFHNQSVDISEQIGHLRRHLAEQGFAGNHAIHSAPLIRREKDYSGMDLTARRKLFRSLFNFMRLCDISHKSFVFRKSEFPDHDKMVSRISREVSMFLRDNLLFLQSFDSIIVYYDNGQEEITNLVNTLFNAFLEADVRKVSPSDYSLFQAADMLCTLALLETKLENEGLSNSETEFFLNTRNLKKNYLKPTAAKRIFS